MSLGRYSIRSKKANKYITIKDNQIVLYEKNQSMSQIFELFAKDNYSISFIDPKTKKYLTLSDSSDQNGAPLLSMEQNKILQKGQSFEVHEADKLSSEVIIFTFCGKCLDCCQEQTKNGTQIIQWDFHGSQNQTWFMQKA